MLRNDSGLLDLFLAIVFIGNKNIALKVYRPFFTADILTFHGRRSTGVAQNINDGSVSHESMTVSQQ